MWKSYCKVLILSCIAPTLIAGLISFLSAVEEIDVIPDVSIPWIWRSRKGITCWHKFGNPNDANNEYCQFEVVDYMANNTQTKEEWQCETRTDLSYRSLYSLSLFVNSCVYLLYIFAAIYGLALFLHDYKLLS